jgi:hypothetical protein
MACHPVNFGWRLWQHDGIPGNSDMNGTLQIPVALTFDAQFFGIIATPIVSSKAHKGGKFQQ